MLRRGEDLALIALGPLAMSCLEAAELLARQGIEAEVALVSCVEPAPSADLAQLLGRHRLAITAEAHSPHGALGSCVAELIAERGLPCKLRRRGLSLHPASLGSKRYLEARAGLSATGLAQLAAESLRVLPRHSSLHRRAL